VYLSLCCLFEYNAAAFPVNTGFSDNIGKAEQFELPAVAVSFIVQKPGKFPVNHAVYETALAAVIFDVADWFPVNHAVYETLDNMIVVDWQNNILLPDHFNTNMHFQLPATVNIFFFLKYIFDKRQQNPSLNNINIRSKTKEKDANGIYNGPV
jgi:hypothetical protein